MKTTGMEGLGKVWMEQLGQEQARGQEGWLAELEREERIMRGAVQVALRAPHTQYWVTKWMMKAKSWQKGRPGNKGPGKAVSGAAMTQRISPPQKLPLRLNG